MKRLSISVFIFVYTFIYMKANIYKCEHLLRTNVRTPLRTLVQTYSRTPSEVRRLSKRIDACRTMMFATIFVEGVRKYRA